MYDDDGIGYMGKSNMEVEDVERRSAEMRNDGESGRRYGRGDEDGGNRDERTAETVALEAWQKKRTVGDTFWGRARG